jgi:hypothetical protein
MTKSFAHFARGNLPASFYVQPMGFLLAILAASTFWASLYAATTGRAVSRLLWRIPSKWYLVVFLGFGTAAWGWKILIHSCGMDGW